MSLHPEVEKMIALGPKAMTVGGNPVVEDDRAFARRIALRAVELEREEWKEICYGIAIDAKHYEEAIRRRGKP